MKLFGLNQLKNIRSVEERGAKTSDLAFENGDLKR
jgi:hypothetical protein